jgi:hypothetical protein
MQAVCFHFAQVQSVVVEMALVGISAFCDNMAVDLNTQSENGCHSVFAEQYTEGDQDSVVAVAVPSHCGGAHC